MPFEEYDQNIYVQITPPKAGGTPAKSLISHNLPEHMSLISIDWYDDEEWKTPTVFEKGKTYWCYNTSMPTAMSIISKKQNSI